MDEKELRKTLEIQLDTLRRNLEVVSLDVLKTKYKKPYDELRGKDLQGGHSIHSSCGPEQYPHQA